MKKFKLWGAVLIVMSVMTGCSESGQNQPPPSPVTAAALPQGTMTYQEVLEKGGTVHNLAMRAADQIWVGTNSGLYHSTANGGWGLLSSQLEFQDIVGWYVYPDDPDHIVIAGNSGVMRSKDGGVNWESIGNGFPSPANIRSFVGIEEKGSIRLCAFVSGEGIYHSNDDGENWSMWLPMDQEVYAMDFNPEENRLYVAAQFSLFYHEDGEWKSEVLPQAEQTYSLAVDERSGVLAVATEQGVFEKEDGEWRLLDAKAPEKLIVVAPGEGDTEWIGIGESALIYSLADDRWTKWN
jgi:ligand-binding sensor domain-containing protein